MVVQASSGRTFTLNLDINDVDHPVNDYHLRRDLVTVEDAKAEIDKFRDRMAEVFDAL